MVTVRTTAISSEIMRLMEGDEIATPKSKKTSQSELVVGHILVRASAWMVSGTYISRTANKDASKSSISSPFTPFRIKSPQNLLR
jgi:hypothetical protein